jgi:serine/threonine protein kinase
MHESGPDEMTTPRTCLQCDSPLAPDAPHGLCPRCLLDGARRPAPAQVGTTPPGAPFAAPEPAELAPLFPQLEVLELLGQGGMGAVYKARQVALDRLVALKILSTRAEEDPEFAERFTREARALARLNHPNIVTVYDSGRAGGRFYLLMEYVDGPNLRRVIAAKTLRPEEALRIVPQLCDALQYAHEEGVVHRDVKPENVLLDRKGRVKVADFGLAKLLGGAARGPTLTGTGQVMGTWHYMAPEQIERPQAVDHRADIYALGVVFYELLTGELPLGRFPPPSAKAAVDAQLDGIVLRAMEKEPERRYQQAGEVKTDVEAVSGVRPAPGALARRTRRPLALRPEFWALAASVAVAVACFLPWSHFSASPRTMNVTFTPSRVFSLSLWVELEGARPWGLASRQGVTALAVAVTLTFLLAAAGFRTGAGRWLAPVTAAGGLAILGCAALYVRAPPAPPAAEWVFYSGDFDDRRQTFERKGELENPALRDAAAKQFAPAVRVRPLVGVYLTLVLGAVLVMLGVAPVLRPMAPDRGDPRPAVPTASAGSGDPSPTETVSRSPPIGL